MAEWFRALVLIVTWRSRVLVLHPAATSRVCFSAVPRSNPQSCFVNNQLVCLLPVGIFHYITFRL